MVLYFIYILSIMIYKFILCFFLIPFISSIGFAEAYSQNYIAFNCNRPTMVFLNGTWISDYNQDCLKNEMDIISYCRRKFSNKSIIFVEAAFEKIKFFKWCDFDGKNCHFNEKIRPFNCIESNSPTNNNVTKTSPNCYNGHMGGDTDCKMANAWISAVRRFCSVKYGGEAKSFGMLNQCGVANNKMESTFFKRVEFVCCQRDVKSGGRIETIEEDTMYHPIQVHGVIETEDEENDTFEKQSKRLHKYKMARKRNIIDNFKKDEMKLMNLFHNDPRALKIKEQNLISNFKSEYRAFQYEIKDREETLLRFHDDRLKVLYTNKVNTAYGKLEEVLRNPLKNESEIRYAMTNVLDLLMLRKREILEDRFLDKTLNSQLIPDLSAELKIITRNISDIFSKLNLVPQFKTAIKAYIVMHLSKKFPRVSYEKISDAEESPGKETELNKIISKYRIILGFNDDDNENKMDVNSNIDIHYNNHVDNHPEDISKTPSWMRSLIDGKNLPILLMFVTTIIIIVILLISVAVVLRVHVTRTRRPKKRNYKRDLLIKSVHIKTPNSTTSYNTSIFPIYQTEVIPVPIDDNQSTPLFQS